MPIGLGAAAIIGGSSLLGGIFGSKGAKSAANTESAALLEQARMQGQLSRDLMQTQLGYATEQRDIELIGSEPYRNSAALALAGMMDMTGLDRGALPGTSPRPITTYPGEDGAVSGNMVYDSSAAGGRGGWMERPSPAGVGASIPAAGTGAYPGWGGFRATEEQIAGMRAADPEAWEAAQNQWGGPRDTRGAETGGSMYSPSISYDLDRLRDPSRIVSDAPQFDFQTDPSYQFRFGEGQRALESSAAARGGVLSGGNMRDLTEYGQNMASQEFGNIYNRLSTIAGYAPQGTAQGGNAGAAIGQAGSAGIEAAGGIGAAGGARAAGQAGSYNAWGSAIQQGAGMLGYGMDQGWFGGGGGGGGGSYRAGF